ncbi:hypothetical protein B0T17DRAFT_503958 [Bombardia bombarda]|uniref:Uncharacterized protein n=1 Tax=Bombardia bombarda TaxID=252184 RepID=A0AA40CF59_9PEZI|nr:hypothetical protein B0T17DRAFT_503958 [Bombardia bombarda]
MSNPTDTDAEMQCSRVARCVMRSAQLTSNDEPWNELWWTVLVVGGGGGGGGAANVVPAPRRAIVLSVSISCQWCQCQLCKLSPLCRQIPTINSSVEVNSERTYNATRNVKAYLGLPLSSRVERGRCRIVQDNAGQRHC